MYTSRVDRKTVASQMVVFPNSKTVASQMVVFPNT